MLSNDFWAFVEMAMGFILYSLNMCVTSVYFQILDCFRVPGINFTGSLSFFYIAGVGFAFC